MYRSTEKLWPSRITGARRRLGAPGSSARRRACAAASSAISVSALASTTMSPGVWARSIGGRSVGDGAGLGGEQVHSAGSEPRASIGGAVEALSADHDEPRRAALAGQPGAVEMLLDAVADRLHDLPAVAAGHVDETLDPQYVVRADQRRRAGRGNAAGSATGPRSTTKLSKSSWSCSPSSSCSEGRAARSSSAAAASPSATAGGTLPCSARDQLHPRPQPRLDIAAQAPRARPASSRSVLFRITRSAQASWSANTSSSGLSWSIAGSARALPGDRLGIVGEAAGGERGGVDHRDDAVDRHAGADLGPGKGLRPAASATPGPRSR